MPPAARQTDKAMHDNPHCHAPIHPPAPTPTPVPHPPIPIAIILNCAPTVLINKLPAAIVTSQTAWCMLPSCVPAGPGVIVQGSATVSITMLPAARSGDQVSFPSCLAPIGSPTGKIVPPCSPNVIIGG